MFRLPPGAPQGGKNLALASFGICRTRGDNRMFKFRTWAAAAAMVALAGTAQASLVLLGDGTVKDDVTNLI